MSRSEAHPGPLTQGQVPAPSGHVVVYGYADLAHRAEYPLTTLATDTFGRGAA